MNSFSHFCPDHIIILAVIVALIIAGLILMSKAGEHSTCLTLRIMSVLVIAVEVLIDVILLADGRNFLDLLPLHLCNLGLFISLAASFTKGKVQSYFTELLLIIIMPGAIGAIMFPDWTYMPAMSLVSILYFLTHSLLVFITLAFTLKRKVKISFRHFWYPYLFLIIVCPPIYILDSMKDLNFMFLIYPPADSPLELLYKLTGAEFYLVGLSLIGTVFLALEYSLYSFALRDRNSSQK